MRIAVLVLLLAMLTFTGRELYLFYGKKSELNAELASMNAEMGTLKSENERLEGDISYYSNPLNLAKEARAQLNAKAPGEKMIIIIPKQE